MSKFLQKIMSFVLVFSLLMIALCMNFGNVSVVNAETKYSVSSAFQNAYGATSDGYKYDFNSDATGADLVSGNTRFMDKISTDVGNRESSMTVTSSKTARFEGFTQLYTKNRWDCASSISFDMKMASSSEDFSGFYIKYGNEIPSGRSRDIVFYSNDGVRNDSANSTTGTTGIGFSYRTVSGQTCIEVFIKYLDNKGKLCVSSQFFYDTLSNPYSFNAFKITDDDAGNISLYINNNLFLTFVCSDLKVPTVNSSYKEKYYSTVKMLDKNNKTLSVVSNALVSAESALAFATRNEILELDNIEISDTGEYKPRIDSVFVTLSKDISLNFVVLKGSFDEAGYSDPVLEVSFDGSDYKLNPVLTEVDGRSSYVFKLENITPQMMNDSVYYTLSADFDGEIVECDVNDYSVGMYLYSQLESTSSTKLRRLLVDILKYGSAAQVLTNHKKSDLVDADLTAIQLNWGTKKVRDFNDSSDILPLEGKEAEATWVNMGLEIKGIVSIAGSFKANTVSGLSVKVADSDGNVIYVIPENQLASKVNSDGTYNVSFVYDKITVSQMSDVFLFGVCDDSGEIISDTYQYSIESRVSQSQETTNAELLNFLNSMMLYGDSVCNYLTADDSSDDSTDDSQGGSANIDEQGVILRQQYVEHLENKYSNYMEVPYGLDITKKTDVVSIFYSTWFNMILDNDPTPPNITEILEYGKNTGVYNWGGEGAFHYWAEPALGYYRSDDKGVIRTHMTQLAQAGVDFIIVDHTYMNKARVDSEWEWEIFITEPCTVLLDTIVEMREEGLKTPYVVFWSGSFSETGWAVVERMYNDIYTVEKWKDCFVYWEGNIFQLLTRTPSTPMKGMELTVREMWGLEQNLGTEKWSFLQHLNEDIRDSDGYTEQMCVCTAAQKDYMSNASTAQGREHGIFMYSQWYHAFLHRPKVISITWWNEWAAQRLPMSDGVTYHFTDNYNQEYSRDIEPMKGGHGDQYYLWMKEYIRAYRAVEECPVLVESGYEAKAKQTALNKYGS